MNFEFRMPVRVMMRDGCIRRAAADIAAFGKRAMVVTDGVSAEKSGALGDMTSVLQAQGTAFSVYNRVESNPTVECVREITQKARDFGADMVVAVGGGSPLDAGKAVSLLLRQEGEVSDADMASGNFRKETVPLVAVPTTSGTGSEVTPFSMLTSVASGRKINLNAPSMYARLALLDPRYTMTVPWNVSVNTALDAISHAVEASITMSSSPLIRVVARESLANAGAILAALEEDQVDLNIRQMMMYDSVLAGIAVGQTRTSAMHGISYSLTYHRHIPHGRAIGLLMVPYLRFTRRERPRMVDEAISAMGLRDLEDLEQKLSLLILNKEHFSEEEIVCWAKEAAGLRNVRNCIVQPTEQDIRAILRQI